MRKVIRMIIVIVIIAVGANLIIDNKAVSLEKIKNLLPWGNGSSGYKSTGVVNDVEEPSDLLVLVNREHALSPDYVPDDLVEAEVPFAPSATDEEKMMRKEAAAALENMFKAAESDGINLCGVSGYRSYESQQRIYSEKLTSSGQDYVDKYVAVPGQSEHQTGLAMDVGIKGVASYDFEKSNEGAWIRDNASNYGFVIRYPEDREDVTGYRYEPWHIRYVGKSVAEEMEEEGMVLEEYAGN